MTKKPKPQSRLSLAPLKFEEAVDEFLKVKPPKKVQQAKKRKGKRRLERDIAH